MIRRLIKINLKGSIKRIHIVVLVIISIILTSMKLNRLSVTNTKFFYMGDVLIEVFGGLSSNFNITENLLEFIFWVISNIVIIYLVDICVIHKFRESTSLILPRAKSKSKWFIAFNLTIIITTIKLYLILFSSSLFLIFIKMGISAFKNVSISINNFHYLNSPINQYIVLFYIFILNVLTMVALLFFINNLYYIFCSSNEASIIGILICLISVNITQVQPLNKYILMNYGMLKRYNIFKLGYSDFNLNFSICNLCVFLVVNLIIGMWIIRKRDLRDI